MIEGLRLDFKAEELSEIFAKAIEQHDQKAKLYQGQIDSLPPEPQQPHTSARPYREQLADHVSRHAHKASVLRVVRDHLVPGETYRLSESDLTQYEIIEDRNRIGW